ncbi:hypothetical protein A9Q94_06510 [Rhodobacterales bacterium 56_14_T64]|mgnify:CR=1 FL=1|nr:hypothetical protein A9Q94_06510 [Rhodobacterales bacterium 56_14_T64]
MLKFMGRSLSLSILSGAIAITFVIIMFLMAVVLVGERPVVRGLACQFGISSDCAGQKLRLELQQEQKRLEQMRGQNRDLMARNQEMEALLKRLASLDHAASSYVIFYEDSNSSPTVTTGHTYASLLDPDTLVSAHCYLQVEVKGAGTRQVNLGKMSDGAKISLRNYSKAELKQADLSARELSALQSRCQWPEKSG